MCPHTRVSVPAMVVDEQQQWPFPNRVLCLKKAEWLKTVLLLALPQLEGLALLVGPRGGCSSGQGAQAQHCPISSHQEGRQGARRCPGLSLRPHLSQEAKRHEAGSRRLGGAGYAPGHEPCPAPGLPACRPARVRCRQGTALQLSHPVLPLLLPV